MKFLCKANQYSFQLPKCQALKLHPSYAKLVLFNQNEYIYWFFMTYLENVNTFPITLANFENSQ